MIKIALVLVGVIVLGTLGYLGFRSEPSTTNNSVEDSNFTAVNTSMANVSATNVVIRTCPTGFVLFDSMICSPTAEGVACGEQLGDLLCHQLCEQNTDCPDSSCQEITLYSGDAGDIISVCQISNEPTVTVKVSPATTNTNKSVDSNNSANSVVINSSDQVTEPRSATTELCTRLHADNKLLECPGIDEVYYGITTSPLIVDDALQIFGSDGAPIVSCGGYQAFINEEARLANEQLCQQYPTTNCLDLTDQC